MKKNTGKIGLLLLIGILLISFIFTGKDHPAEASGEILIEGILAHDFIGRSVQEPDSYNSVKFLIDNDPDYRTGWSGFTSYCDNSVAYNPDGSAKLDRDGKPISPWVENGRANTDDSGRDKIYKVSDYRDQIVAKYGVDKYEKALASGKHLVYQSDSKKTIYSKDHHPLPCKGNGNSDDSDKGFYYNNLDFYLTLTFTEGDIPPVGGGEIIGGSCSEPNPDVPKRYEHELDVEVSRIDARTVNLNANTETDVYVSRKSFASSRQAAKAEFDAYIAEINGLKTECEELIRTWEAEIADLESQKAECEATEPEEVEDGEEAPEPPDCSGFDDDIAQYEEQIADAETYIQKYNQLIGKAESELSYIRANESTYNVVSPSVYLKYNGSTVANLSVSLSEGQSMVRYTFPSWRVTEQGRDVMAQINESGPYQEFQYTNLQGRSAQSLGYHSSLGHVLYSNSSSNNWKDTTQYVATYAGPTCSVANPNDFFKDQTVEGIVRTVNDNGSKRNIKETLTSTFTKLPRTEMRAGHGFEYELTTVYQNHDTEPNPATASGTKNVESYFPTLVNHLPYVRGGAKPSFDLNGNTIPSGGTDEGYRVTNETKQPNVPRNETKAWILPPVAVEQFSGNVFSVRNNDYLHHIERNPYEVLLTEDKQGKPFHRWYTNFTDPDGEYLFTVRTYDAGVNHLNTCHTGKVLIDGVIIGEGNGNDDYVKRAITPALPFPSGVGWNWTNQEYLLTDLSEWYFNWYPKPYDLPTNEYDAMFYLTPEIMKKINEYTTEHPNVIPGQSIFDHIDIPTSKVGD